MEDTIFTIEPYGAGRKKKYKIIFLRDGEYRLNKIGDLATEEEALNRTKEAFPKAHYCIPLDFHHIHKKRIEKLILAPTSLEELEYYLLVKSWYIRIGRDEFFTLEKTREGYVVGEYRGIPMSYPRLDDAIVALLHDIGFWQEKNNQKS